MKFLPLYIWNSFLLNFKHPVYILVTFSCMSCKNILKVYWTKSGRSSVVSEVLNPICFYKPGGFLIYSECYNDVWLAGWLAPKSWGPASSSTGNTRCGKKQTNIQIATNNHLHQINFSTSVVHQQLAGGMELYCPQTLLTRPTNYLLHFWDPLLHKIQQLVGAGVTIPWCLFL